MKHLISLSKQSFSIKIKEFFSGFLMTWTNKEGVIGSKMAWSSLRSTTWGSGKGHKYSIYTYHTVRTACARAHRQMHTSHHTLHSHTLIPPDFREEAAFVPSL